MPHAESWFGWLLLVPAGRALLPFGHTAGCSLFQQLNCFDARSLSRPSNLGLSSWAGKASAIPNLLKGGRPGAGGSSNSWAVRQH